MREVKFLIGAPQNTEKEKFQYSGPKNAERFEEMFLSTAALLAVSEITVHRNQFTTLTTCDLPTQYITVLCNALIRSCSN